MICLNIKKYRSSIFLAVVAVVFFIATSYINFSTQFYLNQSGEEFVKWASPDETANYVFAKYYAQTGSLIIHEEYNKIASDVMHPRSVRSDNGDLKPVSFLGIILIYGKIASIFGYQIIPFLTPFFAAIGVIYFSFLVRMFFGKNNAILSSLLLATFPPYVYYTTRSMFHNVLFVVLLIIALYYGVLMIKFWKQKNEKINIHGLVFSALSGLFLGFAVMTRTSELMWLMPILFIFWVFNFKKIGLNKLIIFISFTLLGMLPMFYYNMILYGSYFFGGYPEMNKSIVEISSAGTQMITKAAVGKFSRYSELLGIIKSNVFHFGFNPSLSLLVFKNYFVYMFSYVFSFGVLGVIFYILKQKKIRKFHFVYFSVYLCFSIILIFYYGSWVFNDNPDATRHTIGNSYTRYWLPIYLGFFPFVSFFIIYLSKYFSKICYSIFSHRYLRVLKSKFVNKKIFKFIFQFVAILLLVLNSINFVVRGSEEGLVFQKRNQEKAIKEWRRVIELTEHNSVIITIYHDKLFFPERKVVVGDFSDKNLVKIYYNLEKELPVYYYNFSLPQDSIDYLNNSRLFEDDLKIEKIEKINDSFTLYKILSNN